MVLKDVGANENGAKVKIIVEYCQLIVFLSWSSYMTLFSQSCEELKNVPKA